MKRIAIAGGGDGVVGWDGAGGLLGAALIDGDGWVGFESWHLLEVGFGIAPRLRWERVGGRRPQGDVLDSGH